MSSVILFAHYSLYGNQLSSYGTAGIVFLAVLFGLRLAKTVFARRVQKFSEHTVTPFDDMIVQSLNKVGQLFYFVIALWAATAFLIIPSFLSRMVVWAAALVTLYYVGALLQNILEYFFEHLLKTRVSEEGGFDPSVVRLLSKAAKGMIWGLLFLVLLQNFGYNISALLAGLGVGGIAIAFALQNVLTDIFASFSIYFDKPFKTGDFVIAGDVMGTVRHIGIKSTRITSLWGEEIVFPNKRLTDEKVHNYKQMENRRLIFSFGVAYETPSQKLRSIPKIIQDIFNSMELASLDRAHFKSFGDFSLNFEVMYTLQSADYNVYMDLQQEVNLRLKESLEKYGIEFAYPTHTVYIHK